MKIDLIEDEIKVSICCLTFNHEKFIKQTLDSFLMQKTNFPFEILIHDDASTDNTAIIIKEYDKNHPGLFLPIYQTVNQKSIYKSGMNPRFNYPRAKGKYIAICEGDDYWTDPLKLQKQVDFLENNPDYVACYGGCMHVDENNNVIKKSRFENYASPTAEQLLTAQGAMITHSVMFRNIIPSFPEAFSGVPSGDTLLYHLLGFHGHGKFLPTITYSAYRVHSGGIWSSINELKRMQNTFATLSAIKRNLLEHYGKHSKYKKIMHQSVFKNISGYLYLSLYNKQFNLYFSMLKFIISQNNFSKTYLLKEHFIDLFKRVFNIKK